MANLSRLQARLANRVKNRLGTRLGLFLFDVQPPGQPTFVRPRFEVSEVNTTRNNTDRYRDLLSTAGLGMETGMFRVLIPRLPEFLFGLYPPGTWILKSDHWTAPLRCAVIDQTINETDNAFGEPEIEVLLAGLKDEPQSLVDWL